MNSPACSLHLDLLGRDCQGKSLGGKGRNEMNGNNRHRKELNALLDRRQMEVKQKQKRLGKQSEHWD